MINPVVLNTPQVDDHIRHVKKLADPVKPELAQSLLRSRASTHLAHFNLDKSFQPVETASEAVEISQEYCAETSTVTVNTTNSVASPAKLILKENLTLLRTDPELVEEEEHSLFERCSHWFKTLKNFKKLFFLDQISHSN